ncbi:MAG: Lrp/AsnC family transcriptional regulator [Acidimicrobiia bacterium]|nr:Lrp/AsnC family transcriptional regulator [Acidimicrobiia bacterium]
MLDAGSFGRVRVPTGDQEVAASIHLDETDKTIIALLQEDGRMPYSKLGPLVGLSPAAVRQRVLALTDSGVIQVVAVTDPTSIGFGSQALVGISVSGDLDDAAHEISTLEEADYVVITTGRFDIITEIVCEDTDHLLRVMNQLRTMDCVNSTELFTYLRLAKQTYDWGTR